MDYKTRQLFRNFYKLQYERIRTNTYQTNIVHFLCNEKGVYIDNSDLLKWDSGDINYRIHHYYSELDIKNLDPFSLMMSLEAMYYLNGNYLSECATCHKLYADNWDSVTCCLRL